MGQLLFTLGHWSQFANWERFYPTCQRPGLKAVYFWTLVEEHIMWRRVGKSRMKGEENAHIFLFVSLGGRKHWDCRAGCLLTMLKWPLKKGSAMLRQRTHFLCRLCTHRTHTVRCVCSEALSSFNILTRVALHSWGCSCALRGPNHLTHTGKWREFYVRFKFLWRNKWFCPWSSHWNRFNINVLFKNASFASKVAQWAALEPIGSPGGPG